MLVFRFLKDYFNFRALAIVILAGKVNSKFCNGGHICSPPKECCPLGCCLVFASPGYRPTKSQSSETTSSMSNFLLWNHWLFWILLFLLLLIFLCGCGLWKKRQLFSNRLYRRTSRNEEERSEFDSTGSCYPPPQYSRCSSFHYAPPPYTEVTSKPDLYPLVISYTSDNGKFSDNCVVVQYFRNYIVHPALGPAGNEIDPICSGFYTQSVQEGDTNFLPSYEESRIVDQIPPELEVGLNSETSTRGHLIHEQQQQQISRTDDNQSLCSELPQIMVGNIHQSLQNAVIAANDTPNFKSNLREAVKKNNTIKHSIQSLSGKSSEQRINSKTRSRHFPLSTFKRMNQSHLLSNSADPIIGGGYSHPAHKYSSDVILAQPQSYCESNNDLHYDSTDVLNNASNFRVDSYSSEDNLSQPRGSLQDFVSSDGLSHSQFSNLEANNFSTSSEVSSLQGCGSPDSPPRATSPTGEFRNLLEKIQQLPKQKYNGKFLESKSYEFLNGPCQPTSSGDNLAVARKVSATDSGLKENETSEKSTLLRTPSLVKFKYVRPNKLPFKQNFPSRSKTFFIPFCYTGSNNTKLRSTSAPVTPNGNFPSSSPLPLHFITNSNKSASKKSLESKADSVLLLREEEEEEIESNDEFL